jgi:hypothetical protein
VQDISHLDPSVATLFIGLPLHDEVTV